jgi:hypothetical protein
LPIDQGQLGRLGGARIPQRIDDAPLLGEPEHGVERMALDIGEPRDLDEDPLSHLWTDEVVLRRELWGHNTVARKRALSDIGIQRCAKPRQYSRISLSA